MPLKKGHSREAVASNIKEMIAAGHKPKQAIAASLAMKRKSMAEGGEVEDDNEDSMLDNPVEIQEKGRYEDDTGVGGSDELVKALGEQLVGMAYGGLIEEGDDVEPGEVENVPSRAPDTLDEAQLSDAAKEALRDKKKRFRF